MQIVKFDENLVKATLDGEAFEQVIQARPETKDLPTIVISIGGVTRSGKSFLLNLLVNYMKHLEMVILNFMCMFVYTLALILAYPSFLNNIPLSNNCLFKEPNFRPLTNMSFS